MPIIMYTDNVIGENGLPINTTPAATYATTDIFTILDRIADGTIVCGTGTPYPVNWNNDDSQNNNGNGSLPWYENYH